MGAALESDRRRRRGPRRWFMVAAPLLLMLSAQGASAANDEDTCAAGQRDRSIAACTRLLSSPRLSPEDQLRLTALRASAFRGKGDLDRAIADFNRLVELARKSASNDVVAAAHVARAGAYLLKGQTQLALDDYRAALALSPNNQQAADAIGRLQPTPAPPPAKPVTEDKSRPATPERPAGVAPPAQSAAANVYRSLNLFGAMFDQTRGHYVEKVDDQKLIENAISGLLNALDPHSSYIDPAAYENMERNKKQELGGIGLEVTMANGLVTVVAPIDEMPAAKAGVRGGDIITHLDDEAVQGLTLTQAVEKMRGPVKTKIRLKIMRKRVDKPIEISITRDVIRVRSVRSRIEGDDIGYIRLTQFNEVTTTGLKQAVGDLRTSVGADRLKGYIVDLRNNSGGLFDQAVSVSDAFLKQGEIVSTRGRDPDETQRYTASEDDIAEGKPIIVLIDGGSVGASEIVAAALQDNRRATLVGTRTFGMGSLQTIIPLSPGNGALRLTTARYFTPTGRSFQATGIAPDIEIVQRNAPQEPVKSEASLRTHLKGEGAERFGSATYVPPQARDDSALQTAVELLRGVRKHPAFPPNPALPVPN